MEPLPYGVPPPLVSVIVPVKDTPAEMLESAVRSVVGQNCAEPVEVVVWNDGSTNPSTLTALERLPSLSTPDRTVRVFGSTENRGISAARNGACRMAHGSWLLWLDSDDMLPSQAVGSLLAPLLSRLRSAEPPPEHRRAAARAGLRPTADWSRRVRLVLGRCRVDQSGRHPATHHGEPFVLGWRHSNGTLDDPLLRVVFAVHGALVERDLFDEVGGFDETLPYAELTDLFLRLMRVVRAEQVGHVRAVTYHYVKRTDSHSADRQHLERDRAIALRRYAEDLDLPVRPAFGSRCPRTGARLYDLCSDTGSLRFTIRDRHDLRSRPAATTGPSTSLSAGFQPSDGRGVLGQHQVGVPPVPHVLEPVSPE